MRQLNTSKWSSSEFNNDASSFVVSHILCTSRVFIFPHFLAVVRPTRNMKKVVERKSQPPIKNDIFMNHFSFYFSGIAKFHKLWWIWQNENESLFPTNLYLMETTYLLFYLIFPFLIYRCRFIIIRIVDREKYRICVYCKVFVTLILTSFIYLRKKEEKNEQNVRRATVLWI